MAPIRILFTLPSLAPTDSKLPRILAICKALDRRYFQPLVSVDHVRRLHPDGLALLKQAHIPVHVIRMSPHKKQYFRSILQLFVTPITLRKLRVVIQHSSDFTNIWSEPVLARLGGVRYWIATKTNAECSGWRWRLRLKLAHQIIVQSPQIVSLLVDTIPNISQQLTLIPNGVDINRYRPRARDPHLAAQLSIESDDIVLGCVAHLVPVKDHLNLIRAFSLVQFPNLKLLLIGAEIDQAYSIRIRDLVHELGLEQRVLFLGRRSDVTDLHSIFDGLILTSVSESSSNAILEGMASGLPIITSDGANQAGSIQSNYNGWVIRRDKKFVTELANAIVDWAAEPEKRILYGHRSRQLAVDKYSMDKMVQQHIILFKSLINQTP